MKVLLLQSIPSLGEKGELKIVSKGYARNYLLPRRLAVFATPERIAVFEEMKKKQAKERVEKQELIKKIITAVRDSTITLQRSTTPGGTLYASITIKDIMDVLASHYHLRIPKDGTLEPPALKHTGEHRVMMSLHGTRVPLKIVIESL